MSEKENKINYLDLTPVRVYGQEESENGNIAVLVPRFTSKFWNKIFRNSNRKFIFVKLDEFGSQTWRLIDGKRNVQEICEVMFEKFGERIHPVEERVTMFMTELYKNGFVRLEGM